MTVIQHQTDGALFILTPQWVIILEDGQGPFIISLGDFLLKVRMEQVRRREQEKQK
jgi:hypothetical protein